MGVRTHSSIFTDGGSGCANGRNAQCRRSSSVTCIPVKVALALARSGQAAPASIHRRNNAICSLERLFSFFGGIRSSRSFDSTSWIKRLLLLSCGMIPGAPESPPLNTDSRASSRNPPFCFSGPWHLTQCSLKSGTIECSKSPPSAACAFCPARAARRTPTNQMAKSARKRLPRSASNLFRSGRIWFALFTPEPRARHVHAHR